MLAPASTARLAARHTRWLRGRRSSRLPRPCQLFLQSLAIPADCGIVMSTTSETQLVALDRDICDAQKKRPPHRDARD